MRNGHRHPYGTYVIVVFWRWGKALIPRKQEFYVRGCMNNTININHIVGSIPLQLLESLKMQHSGGRSSQIHLYLRYLLHLPRLSQLRRGFQLQQNRSRSVTIGKSSILAGLVANGKHSFEIIELCTELHLPKALIELEDYNYKPDRSSADPLQLLELQPGGFDAVHLNTGK